MAVSWDNRRLAEWIRATCVGFDHVAAWVARQPNSMAYALLRWTKAEFFAELEHALASSVYCVACTLRHATNDKPFELWHLASCATLRWRTARSAQRRRWGSSA